MKRNQITKIIYLCSALGFAVTTAFGQTEANSTDKPEAPQPAVKEQQVDPIPTKKEETKSQKPQIVWNGGVMIEEQNKLIRKNQNNLIKSLDSVATEIQKSNKQLENGEVMIEEQNKLIHSNQNDLIKSLDSIVTEIQKSNKQLEEAVKSMSQQQASLAAQLAEVSKRLDETIKGVQTNADQATATLKTSFEAKVEQLSIQIDTNQEQVKALQDKHFIELTDSTGLANEGVNENKALLEKIQSENSQLQEKISSLDNEIGELEANAKENHEKVQGALGSISSKLVLSFVLKTIVILAALGLGFYVWKNKQMIAALITGKNNSDQAQFESIFNDERYLDGLNKVVDLLNATGKAGPAQEQDHGLPRSVADEINRMRVRLSKMEKEDDVKVKPLQKALERMQEKLESMGYEIVDLMDEPYVEGMNVTAQFIPDDTLPEGKKIIRRVISPLVNFKGKLIQRPEVEVSVGG